MPPALSDESASESEQEIPPKKAQNGAADDDAEDEDDEEEDNEEEYQVEKIKKHGFTEDGSTLLLFVKWAGYPDSDNTWEPEDNLLDSAEDILKAYYKKIGGRPKSGDEKKEKKKRRTSEADVEESTPQPGRGRGRKKAKTDEVGQEEVKTLSATKKRNKEWEPPKGSWEHEIETIDSIEEHPDPKTGENIRWAYVIWNNSRQTRHKLELMNIKAPQKMLKFYEQHLHFKVADPRPNVAEMTIRNGADEEAILQEDAAAED